jgi:hypothetical protein
VLPDEDPLDRDLLDVEPADGVTDLLRVQESPDSGPEGEWAGEMIAAGAMTVVGATNIVDGGTFCDCACGCRRRATDHVCDACRTGDHSGGRDPFGWSDGWPRPHARDRGRPRAPGAA